MDNQITDEDLTQRIVQYVLSFQATSSSNTIKGNEDIEFEEMITWITNMMKVDELLGRVSAFRRHAILVSILLFLQTVDPVILPVLETWSHTELLHLQKYELQKRMDLTIFMLTLTILPTSLVDDKLKTWRAKFKIMNDNNSVLVSGLSNLEMSIELSEYGDNYTLEIGIGIGEEGNEATYVGYKLSDNDAVQIRISFTIDCKVNVDETYIYDYKRDLVIEINDIRGNISTEKYVVPSINFNTIFSHHDKEFSDSNYLDLRRVSIILSDDNVNDQPSLADLFVLNTAVREMNVEEIIGLRDILTERLKYDTMILSLQYQKGLYEASAESKLEQIRQMDVTNNIISSLIDSHVMVTRLAESSLLYSSRQKKEPLRNAYFQLKSPLFAVDPYTNENNRGLAHVFTSSNALPVTQVTTTYRNEENLNTTWSGTEYVYQRMGGQDVYLECYIQKHVAQEA